MKALLLLAALAAPTFASAPPYFGQTINLAAGTATQYLSGNLCVAASSPTAGTCNVTLAGSGVISSTVTSGANLILNKATGASMSFNRSNATQASIGENGSGGLNIYANGSTLMETIDSGGVAIGTTNTNTSSGNGLYLTIDGGSAGPPGAGNAGRGNLAIESDVADSTTPTLIGTLHYIYGANPNTGHGDVLAAIDTYSTGTATNDKGGLLQFWTKGDGIGEFEHGWIDQHGVWVLGMNGDTSGGQANVGIGQAVPTAALDVYAVSGANVLLEKSNSAPNLGLTAGAGKNEYFQMSGGSVSITMNDDITDIMTWAQNGFVGIGEGAPGNNLDIEGLADGYGITLSATGTNRPAIIMQNASTGPLGSILATNTKDIWLRSNGGNTTAMDVTSSGNIGIGTVSPQNNVDIEGASDGNGLTVGAATTSRPQIILSNANSGSLISMLATNTSDYWLRTKGGTVNALAALSSGNVGIGKLTASFPLDVNGVAVSSGVTDGSYAAAGRVGEFFVSSNTAGTSFGTTAQYADMGNIPLTAGDWDCNLVVVASLNGATITGDFQMGIGIASGNSSSGLSVGDTRADFSPPLTANNVSASISGAHFNNAASQTYYAKIYGNYTGGPPQYYYRFSCRRAR